MTNKKQVHLGAFLQGVGHSIAWRHPAHASFTELETYVQFAQIAERGKLDFIFFAEGLVIREHRDRFFGPIVNGRPDTLTLLPALASVTDKIGLAATISSTYNEPFELARKLASLDIVTGGRAAWNVVTTFSNSAAKDSGGDQVAYNFSRTQHLDHPTRYARAREFVPLIKELWDTWEDDALAEGSVSPAKLHRLDHRDPWFQVAGPLDVPRPIQGHPVIIQAGQSNDGRDLAARVADVIFSPFRDFAESKAHYDDVKARLARYGRNPEALRILPGLSVIVAPTLAEAQEKASYYRDLLFSDAIVRYLLAEQSGLDFSIYDLDGPFPDLDAGDPRANGPLVKHWRQIAHEQSLTLRQLAEQAIPRGGLVGTPAQVADYIQHWVEGGASDGFLLAPQLFPGDLNDFVSLVVPELQSRGIFRTEYTGTTLRDHLGLPRPVGPAVAAL